MYNFWLEANMVLMNDFFIHCIQQFFVLFNIYLNGGPDSSYWKFMFIYFYNKKKMRILNATQSIQKVFLKESDVFEKCTIINFSCFHFTTQHILVALISTFTFHSSYAMRNIHKYVIKQITGRATGSVRGNCVKWWV